MTKKSHQPAPEPETKEPKVRRRSKAFYVFLGVTGAVLLSLASFAGYAFAFSHKMAPHTTIAGVQVGGLGKDEAGRLLADKEKAFAAQQLMLSHGGKTWNVSAEKLSLSFDNAQALEEAYAYGKSGGFGQQVAELAKATVSRRYFEVDMASLSGAAKDALHSEVFGKIENPPAETTLSFKPGNVAVVPGTVGQKVDINAFEAQLYRAFKQDQPAIAVNLIDFQPEVTAAQAEPARVAAQRILTAPWQITAGNQTVTWEPKDIAGWFSTSVAHDATGLPTGLDVVVNQESVKKAVQELASKADTKPVNAQLQGQPDGSLKVIQDAKDGQGVDQDKTVADLMTALTSQADEASAHTFVATIKTLTADLTKDTLAAMGVKELIGTATTDFSGSPANRTYNIGLGQRSLNGGLVKDGETYSTIGSLGPIEISTGYKPELVIINNHTTPEAGGGLCQVSTTLFRAVLNAGLPVTDRTNHAYRVGYYERGVGPGLDATVYDPNPDFKWKNDTGHAVYIESYVKGTTITFELYGTKDGRVATISAPQILEQSPPGDPIYADTDTLYKGETKQTETAHGGAKTLVTYTVTRNGQEINKQDFRSTYKPWPAQYLVGTKDRPAS